MVITYYGKQYFKLTLGDLTIATNPPLKASKPARFGADIVLISLNHPDYNDPETVTMGEREPFALDSAGSYEVKELFFTGAGSTVTVDKKDYINTVYGFELDGIKIAYLGAVYDEKSLSTEAKEIAGAADMILVNIGQDPVQAYKMTTSFDPNMIIPMDYDTESLKRFLKEAGQEKAETQDKVTLKRRDLDGKQSHVVILAPQG